MRDPFADLVAPVLVEMAAEEIVGLVLRRARDARLRWSKDGQKVQIQTRHVVPYLQLPDPPPQDELHSNYEHAGTLTRRLRKRANRDQQILEALMKDEVRERLSARGWEPCGGAWWAAPPEGEDDDPERPRTGLLAD